MLSSRGNRFRSYVSLLIKGFQICASNKYSTENPTGIINLGVAENRLMTKELLKKLNEICCFVDENSFEYGDMSGRKECKEEVSDLYRRLHGADVVPSDVIVMSGVTTVVEALFSVICDKNDVVLIPTPLYGGFISDLDLRSGIQVFPVEPSLGFIVSVDDIIQAYAYCKKKGLNVKSVLITHPGNPIGHIFSKETLISICNFCKTNNLHFIVDEIYSFSVFDSTQFPSSLTVLQPHPLLHVLWGFSKDFCMNGFRVGCLFTRNAEVRDAVGMLAGFTAVSSTTQNMLAKVLADKEWVDEFMASNKKKLLNSYGMLTKFLKEKGIEYVGASAGFFLWIDLRFALVECAKSEELALWESLLNARVNIVPASAFSSAQFGYFRISFGEKWDLLELGLHRMLKGIELNLSNKNE